MPIEQLTELQYSDERKGPFKLYVYEPNSEFHTGGVWFENKPKYPEEELTISEAHSFALTAMTRGREVRVCDGGDKLVFHAKGRKILYPESPKNFWKEITEYEQAS